MPTSHKSNHEQSGDKLDFKTSVLMGRSNDIQRNKTKNIKLVELSILPSRNSKSKPQNSDSVIIKYKENGNKENNTLG